MRSAVLRRAEQIRLSWVLNLKKSLTRPAAADQPGRSRPTSGSSATPEPERTRRWPGLPAPPVHRAVGPGPGQCSTGRRVIRSEPSPPRDGHVPGHVPQHPLVQRRRCRTACRPRRTRPARVTANRPAVSVGGAGPAVAPRVRVRVRVRRARRGDGRATAMSRRRRERTAKAQQDCGGRKSESESARERGTDGRG